MKDLASAFRLLADETRLRTLRLLAREELNAGELTGILGLGQSSVSRQLAILRDSGLVRERREGRFVYFALSGEAALDDGLWAAVVARVGEEDDETGDLARLEEVLRERRERRLLGDRAGDGAGRRAFVPGRSWAAWARALAWLVPSGLRAVDLGCGDGALTLEIARFARRVVGVDVDAAVLRRARALARRRRVANVGFRRADMGDLPFEDGAFDLAVLSQALHHVREPSAAVGEARRVLAPGGRILVLDLRPHGEEWVRDRLGHRHLGFEPGEVETLLRGAGFRRVRVEPLPARSDDPFRVLLAGGEAPAVRVKGAAGRAGKAGAA